MRPTYFAPLFAVLATLTACSTTDPALNTTAETAYLTELKKKSEVMHEEDYRPGPACPARQNLWCTAGVNGADCRCVDNTEALRRIVGRPTRRGL